MKTDGYIFTPELLQWRYFHRPVVVQVLVHVLLSSAHNEASAATLSYRDMALQLHTTVKTIRVAIDVLIAEKIITKCSAPRASTKLYVNSSHPLSHCIIPWQRDQGAQATAQYGAQIGAHTRAQISQLQQSENQGCKVYYQDERGTDWGAVMGIDGAQPRAQQKRGAQQKAQSRAQISQLQQSENQGCKVYYQDERGTDWGAVMGIDGAQPRAQQKRGAQQKAQSRAQISQSQTSDNQDSYKDLDETKGTDKDKAKGTLAREGKKEKTETKENLSPEPPLKEKKEKKERRQERAHTQTQKKEKEKKVEDSEIKFAEVLRLFNRLFLGTQVKPISKMTPDRKKLVAKFISDYSYEEVETMLRKALNSDLLSGRKDGGCYISFNWLFNPKNYEPLMEGTFDNPTVAASAKKKPQPASSPVASAPPQPQHEETNEEIEARLRQKEERKKAIEREQTEALRQKYLGWIEASKKNPDGSMAKMVRKAYKDGKLAELGITWNPSVAEEEQSLADLDDQTQSYLQSLLSD